MSEDYIQSASKIFGASLKQLKKFELQDPFNPQNTVRGYLCKKEGKYGGSIFITHVNNHEKVQVIYGTPKLAYPYKNFETFEYSLPQCHSFFIGNKFNGMNVLVYKYYDHEDNVYYTMKSKGIAFLKNGSFGNFLDLSCSALNIEIGVTDLKKLEELKELQDPSIQSKTFELCGRKEPHLVYYDFDIALKPLFITYNDGTITPCVGVHPENEHGPSEFVLEDVINLCKHFQKVDEEKNEAYRKSKGLKRKYEYNHFIVEGRVLYCLDENGKLINRTMYKIKPHDIEEVHWSNFDDNMKGRVDEVLKKLKVRDIPITEESIQEELDMGKKEWGRFSKGVISYVKSLGYLN